MKKGYVFSLDAAIAILILIIGFAIIYYQFGGEKTTTYMVERLSVDVIGVLAHTRVSDLCVMTEDSCGCPNYPRMQDLVCGTDPDLSPGLRTRDPTILEMFTEVIETGTRDGNMVEETIHELFVTSGVIDENRFGFSVLYTDPIYMYPLELYNTENYSP